MTFVADIKRLHIEPTTVCQAECPMCIRTILGYHNGTMENKELSKEIELLGKSQVKIENEIEVVLSSLPNIALDDVPIGKNESSNNR